MKFGQFQEALLSHDVYAKGKLILPNEKRAEVSAFIGGITKQIFVRQGEYVKKGQPLCRLVYPDIIEVQQEYLNAKYDLELASGQYDRQKLLLNEDISSKKAYQLAERNYLSAKVNYEALMMNIELAGFDLSILNSGKISDHLDIRSPISGKVTKVNLNMGHYVEPGLPLFGIADISELFVELMVFEKDIQYVEPGQRVTMTLSNISDDVIEGEIFSIGSTMEEMARTVPAIAHFEEMPAIAYPGMFVASTIHTGESMYNALPESAIVSEGDGENYFYYTMNDPKNDPEIQFEKVGVNLLLVEDGFASMELVDPLPDGSRIVVEGGYYIRSMYIRSVE
jgi:cobalt-zinc-cadmium efflux system membrane fusion protein